MTSRRRFLGTSLAALWSAMATSRIASGANSASETDPQGAISTSLQKRDYCRKPFRLAVALGDSITAGGTATSRELDWVSHLAELINQAQLTPIQIINSGIGGNQISPRSAYYDQTGKVSAMERYQKHVVDHQPDLVLISYGVNDSMTGTPVEQFLDDLQHIASDIREKTHSLVVILGPYFVKDFHRYAPALNGSVASLLAYNCAIKRMAEECDMLFVDVFAAYGMAPWAVDEDGIHPNNLGHTLVANRIFEVLAQNCSCLSEKALELRKTFRPWRDESALRKTY
jgi:lysophospholipase L1-like esterase